MSRQELPVTLADEGAYFVANNAQTGVAMTTTVAFSATAPFLIIQNTAAAGGKKIYLDYLDLVTTAAGSAASGLTLIQAAVYLDSILRYSSGGTNLTANIVCPNVSLSPTSVAAVYVGAITAAAASAARAVCGLRTIRPTVSGTVADVVGDTKHFSFGGGALAHGGMAITVASPNVIPVQMPPIVIGPQQSALIHLFYAAATTPVAASYAPELAWSER
jgi:hypothetical protein